MGSLAGGAQISSLSLTTPVATFPPGMFPHFSGNLALISGIPNANGSYAFGVKADYATGVDSAGNRYPAGVVTGSMSVAVTGCPAASLSWTGGANTCYGSVGNSANVGQSTTIAATSASPAGAAGSNVLSCNVLGGSWVSGSNSCVASAPAPAPDLSSLPTWIVMRNVNAPRSLDLYFDADGVWRIVASGDSPSEIPVKTGRYASGSASNYEILFSPAGKPYAPEIGKTGQGSFYGTAEMWMPLWRGHFIGMAMPYLESDGPAIAITITVRDRSNRSVLSRTEIHYIIQ